RTAESTRVRNAHRDSTPPAGAQPGPRLAAARDSSAKHPAAAPLRGLSLQAYDPAAGPGIGVVAGIGPMPDGRLGARFLLLLGDQCLTMFTGEEASPRRSAVGGLELRPTERGLALRFAGPALWIPDGARHFRFEAAQSAARVVEVAARLELT